MKNSTYRTLFPSLVFSVMVMVGGVLVGCDSSGADMEETDSSPPAAPSDVTGLPGDGEVALSWSIVEADDLDGYNVYRSSSTISDISGIDPVNGSSFRDTSYTDTDVSNGTRYYYVVTAVDGSGNESDPSSEVTATPTNVDTEAPSAPSGLTGEGGDATVDLAWDDVSANDLEGYNVYRSTSSISDVSGMDPENGSSLSASSYTDSNVSNGTTYYYVVTAVDESGNESDPSSEVDVTPSSGSGAGEGVYSSSHDEVHKADLEGNKSWIYTELTGNVRGLAVDSDGYVYAGGRDDDVHKISADGSQIWVYSGHSSDIEEVAVDDNGYVYSTDRNSEVHKINSDGEQVWVYTGHSKNVNSVAVDSDGYVYTVSWDEEVHKINPDGQQVWTYAQHSQSVRGVAVDANGYVYSTSNDDTVDKISPDGNQVWTYSGHTDDVESVAVGPDGAIYTSSTDEEVHKVSSSGDHVWAYTGHGYGTVNAVTVDADGYVYSVSEDNEVHKVSPDGNQVWTYTEHSGYVYGVAVSPGTFTVSQGLTQ